MSLTDSKSPHPNPPDVTALKQIIRRRLLVQRRTFSPAAGLRLSRKICRRITSLPEFRKASLVAAYAATPGEVDLTDLWKSVLAAGKILLLPRYQATAGRYEMVPVQAAGDLVPGRFGILEPAPSLPVRNVRKQPKTAVLWLVPGVGFDPAGHRLGRGKGYYDRLLAGVAGTKIGVAFSWQILPELPAGAGDVGMNAVVSENGILRPPGTRTRSIIKPVGILPAKYKEPIR